MTKRTFVAINLNRESITNLERELSLIKSNLGTKNIRWTKPENIHFTLAFLGDIPEVRVRGLSKSLEELAKQFKPFTIILRGMGVFPHPRQPRILWIGAQSEILEKIGKVMQKDLKKDGFRIDDHKPFRAHLTVARVKFADQHLKEKLSGLIEKYKKYEFGHLRIIAIDIMESQLLPEGPKYTVLDRISFM